MKKTGRREPSKVQWNMKKVRVTMRDVARAANVTPQTVSRAIRNAPEVSAETREKVLKVAAELNYVKNNSASSLRCGNSKLIVIIYDHLVNVYFSIMTVSYTHLIRTSSASPVPNTAHFRRCIR